MTSKIAHAIASKRSTKQAQVSSVRSSLISALARRFNPADHPRDEKGRFSKTQANDDDDLFVFADDDEDFVSKPVASGGASSKIVEGLDPKPVTHWNSYLDDSKLMASGVFGKVYRNKKENSVLKIGNISADEIKIQAKLSESDVAPTLLNYGYDPNQPTYGFRRNYIEMEDLSVQGFKPVGSFSNNANFEEISRQAAIALTKLHAEGVAHQDFHENNVLIEPNTMRAKIIDFGLSMDISPDAKNDHDSKVDAVYALQSDLSRLSFAYKNLMPDELKNIYAEYVDEMTPPNYPKMKSEPFDVMHLSMVISHRDNENPIALANDGMTAITNLRNKLKEYHGL